MKVMGYILYGWGLITLITTFLTPGTQFFAALLGGVLLGVGAIMLGYKDLS